MLEMLLTVNRLRPNIPASFGFIALTLAGCSPDTPSHLPNPVLLPAYAVGNAIQNASYNARRSKVKTYVTRNFEALLHDIQNSDGRTLTESYNLAGVPADSRPALTRMLSRDANLSKDPEALTISLMVHGI